jgi:hypothetical protein
MLFANINSGRNFFRKLEIKTVPAKFFFVG